MRYILGDHAARGTPIQLTADDRRRHLYIIGRSGTGKTAFLYNLARQDLDNGRGFCLIDPHGDLALSLANSVPPERIEDVIYFDPLDDFPVAFNPLSFQGTPLQKAKTADDLFSSFKHVWGEFFKLPFWGSQSEYILKNALRLLLDRRGATLLDLPRLLTDDPFREKLIDRCQDRYVAAFWLHEFAAWDKKTRKQAIEPVQNKVGQFATNPLLRAVVGRKSSFNLRALMDSRKVLLCNFGKAIGEESAGLLGAFLVTALWQAAASRADTPEADREDFTLYADEFHAFATDTFGSILSEARKFKLALVLANQFLHQLPEQTREAVIGNVKTMAVFRIGATDAPLLGREIGTAAQSLLDTPDFHAWVKQTDADLMRTRLPLPPTGSFAAVLNHTRACYGRPR
jgi:type IV secretory pathway TraG/TraD family ATPase VirD4